MSGTGPEEKNGHHSSGSTPALGYGVLGGYYAKAKQRVLNKLGRRTTLTKNPRVDYISKKIDKIRTAKEQIASKAEKLKNHLNTVIETTHDLNEIMLVAWKDELGQRAWSEEKEMFVRKYDAEEKIVATEMEEALKAFETKLKTVQETFNQALKETMKKPLTHGTPDEEKRVEQIMARKQEYKHARTVYSDAMIDYDAEVSQGAEPRQRTLEAIEDAKARYEEQSERVTEAALHFEALYREEVCQRIEAHFMSLNHFIRGLYTCFRGYYPYVRSLSFDAREQRSAMKRHVAEAKLEAERDDRVSSTVAASLPKVPYGRSVPKPKSNLDVGSTKMALDSGGLDSMEDVLEHGMNHSNTSGTAPRGLHDVDFLNADRLTLEDRQEAPSSSDILDVQDSKNGINGDNIFDL